MMECWVYQPNLRPTENAALSKKGCWFTNPACTLLLGDTKNRMLGAWHYSEIVNRIKFYSYTDENTGVIRNAHPE